MPNHPSWNYIETMNAIQSIENSGVQDYAKIGYLLGGRITELLSLPPSHIKVKDGIVRTTVNTLKTRRGDYVYRELLNIINDEAFYCQPLLEFQSKGFNSTDLKEYLSIGGKRSIEMKLQRELGIVPHSLRHLRATHMGKNKIPSKIHQNTGPYLKYYFGWASIAIADVYIDKLTAQEIIEQYQQQSSSDGQGHA